MHLYMLAEQDDLDDFAEALFQELQIWAEPKTTIEAIYRHEEAEQASLSKRAIEVGIELTISKAQKLKEPLNQLYDFAKKYKCDFSVGIIEDDKRSDVCFFGFEEGRPDMFEIANYLEL
ncbi:hypothetical protein [Reinekea forsetii]|jgi:hypothetical protein|uniref:hypothetical protein n=1 Tax=Reinekea forsetii TaxID=1336806 RepID=UPI0023533D5B|nr:hypothetical protein [Reinekea forsetii]